MSGASANNDSSTTATAIRVPTGRPDRSVTFTVARGDQTWDLALDAHLDVVALKPPKLELDEDVQPEEAEAARLALVEELMAILDGLVLRFLAWRTDEGKPEATPASLFLARVAPVAHPAHVWRAWRGKGAPAVLPQEEALARLAPPLADEAVRARLASPALDGGGLPVWFASRGWPPADAAEARSWWAAAKGAR